MFNFICLTVHYLSKWLIFIYLIWIWWFIILSNLNTRGLKMTCLFIWSRQKIKSSGLKKTFSRFLMCLFLFKNQPPPHDSLVKKVLFNNTLCFEITGIVLQLQNLIDKNLKLHSAWNYDGTGHVERIQPLLFNVFNPLRSYQYDFDIYVINI